MIEFDRAKLIENKVTGGKGVSIHRIRVIAQVNEAAAKALGDDVRNTLYNSKGVIRPSFGKMDLTHAFADASFHLTVAGIKGAEIRLDGIMAHRFRVAMRGGDKKPKTLLCGFEVEYINRATGASSMELWHFVNTYLNAIGACRLKYPEQQTIFTEPTIDPGVHSYDAEGFSAELSVKEHPEGYASIREAAGAGSKLPQKPPSICASESEALAMAAYDVRSWADKRARTLKGTKRKAAEALSAWAADFVSGPQIPATPVTITELQKN